VVVEHNSNPNSASENYFSVRDLTFEPGHCRNINGDATAGELGWRRVRERDPKTEHRDIVDPASPFAGLALNAADSVPAGTEALDSTAICHSEPLLPAHMVPRVAGVANWSASDDDLFL
jgi:hypothetical protein